MTTSLQDAIARNRARQAAKKSGSKPEPALRPYRVRVATIHPTWMVDLGLAPKLNPGDIIPTEIRTVYGTSRKDAKERAGIQ